MRPRNGFCKVFRINALAMYLIIKQITKPFRIRRIAISLIIKRIAKPRKRKELTINLIESTRERIMAL